MINNFRRKICITEFPKLSGDFAGYHGKMPPRPQIPANKRRFIDSDSVEQDPVPSFVRDMLSRQTSTPFSESRKETFFVTFVKSMDLSKHREGPPKRLSLNSDSISLQNIARVFKLKKKEHDLYQQRFIPERQEHLGVEIGAAHFIVFRGGGVKFFGLDHWIKTTKLGDIDYDAHLPKKFVPTVYLEAIDLSNMDIYYEGLVNLEKLSRLKWARFKNCKHIDDWCLDRIARQFCNTLEYLDISDCPKITYRGLSSLYKLDKLKVLVVNNIASSNEFQLSCLMLEEILPDLKIEGVSYIDLDSHKTDGISKTKENIVKNSNNTALNYSSSP